ncbi:hypothetical protein JCM1840_001183 [Sporobolomyces johnsonii]
MLGPSAAPSPSIPSQHASPNPNSYTYPVPALHLKPPPLPPQPPPVIYSTPVSFALPPPVLPPSLPLVPQPPAPPPPPAYPLHLSHTPSHTHSHPQHPPDQKLDHPPGLSRFAELYIPLWLRRVNADTPLGVIPRTAAEASWIPYEALHDALFPRQLLFHLTDVERKNHLRIAAELSAGKRPPLEPASYAAHWLPVHAAEYRARSLQLQQALLYAVPLRPFTSPAAHTPFGPAPPAPAGPQLYTLEARSIREGWPPVDLGDVLNLRQLRPANGSWQGLEFEASVAGINRAAGEVVLRCDGLMGYQESLVFNVIWRVQDRVFTEWRKSTELLNLYLSQSVSSNTVSLSANPSSATPRARTRSPVESWLFPTQEDLASPDAPPPDEGEQQWVDTTLNEEQRNAVRSILWAQHRAPFLISGPPGTGKTKTLVEAVLQILKRHPHAHVLVCGASNPSTDTLAMRLRSLMPKDLFRLNAPSRPFAEVRAELLPFCHIEGERFALPSMATLLSKRVICCTVLDASILLGARVTNHDLSTLEVYTSGSIHPGTPPALPKPHFSYLLVDEAAQATESDLACAYAAVATDPTRSHPAHITICGDARQLGPHITSEEARAHDLDVSLLERLMDRPVYAEHPCARRNRLKREARWDVRTTPFVDLVRNYRSVEEILWLPSTLFYHETLRPFAPEHVQKSQLRRWASLPTPGFPILFRSVVGDDLEVDEGASFFNEAEVAVVRELILDLVGASGRASHGRIEPREISVISPFREQVWRVRLALRAVGLGEVDVGNVEALQGAENRVVIISTVRSKELRWLPIDRAQNRGLIHEPKRFNVAMTRAKELLVVVGNADTLVTDPYWRAFYNLCLRNRCYVGAPVASASATEAGQAVSKLEQAYRAERSRAAGAGAGGPNGAGGGGGGGRDAGGGEDEEQKDKEREFDVLVGRLVSQLNEDDE